MEKSEIREFANIDTLEKFSEYGCILLSNGINSHYWFLKNKKEIFDSNDPDCKLIKKQYDEHKKAMKERIAKLKKQSFHMNGFNADIANEFKNIKDIKKFDRDSNIFLSNGMLACDWFIANVHSILEDECGMYKEIRKQYYNAKKTQRIIGKTKDKYYFFKDKRLYKFNEFSGIELPSKVMSGVWFLQNKESILNSDNPVDVEIAKQYYEYEIYYALVLEFYYKKDLLKFNEHSNVRFKSGSLMADWWEVNKEKILSSNFFLDEFIKKQYEEYLSNLLDFEEKKK